MPRGRSGALFRIAAGGEMELLAMLAQDDLARINVGTIAQVTPVGSAVTYQGQVWNVAPTVDPQTRQGAARIAIPYNRFMTGCSAAAISARWFS